MQPRLLFNQMVLFISTNDRGASCVLWQQRRQHGRHTGSDVLVITVRTPGAHLSWLPSSHLSLSSHLGLKSEPLGDVEDKFFQFYELENRSLANQRTTAILITPEL